MAGIRNDVFFGSGLKLSDDGAGAQDVIQITPVTAIGGVEWKGIDLDASNLDPTATGATLTGADLNLSGVSLANDPIMNAMHIQMPATFSGAEEKHCMLLEGFGSTVKICDGDDEHAITTDGEIHVDFDASGLAAGEIATVFDSIIELGAATDGHVHALDISTGGTGSVEVIAVSTHPGVDVIHQHIGTSGAIDQGWIELGAGGFTDSTAAFNAAVPDLAIFVTNTDMIYIGMTASFDHIVVMLDTLASKDLRPIFEYSTGAGFSTFSPVDDTNGFQQEGSIFWNASALTGFAARVVNGSANLFFIRITRDRAGALTNPIESTIQTLVATEFSWDKDGDIAANSVLAGISNTGATNTIEVQNPSDTASSSSQIEASVGGTSAGDPWVQWTVGTTRSFAMGIDNSDSDLLTITHDGDATVDPSSGTLLMSFMPATDQVAFFTNSTIDDVGIVKSTAAAAVSLGVKNNDNTNAASDAALSLQVGGASGGDAYVVAGGGGSNFSFGYDNTTEEFRIAQSATFDAVYLMRATTAGEVTFPLTPTFLATHTAAQDNVTGDGTLVTVDFTTEITDQNADYDGTNTFTAPVAGNYRFDFGVQVNQLTAAMTSGEIRIVTSNRSYISFNINYGAIRDVNNNASFSTSILADMDAADTCHIAVIIAAGAKVVDIQNAPTTCFFAGELVS